MAEQFGTRFVLSEVSGDTDAGSLGLRIIWRIIWSRKWVIALLVVVFIALGVQSDLRSPATFTAEAMLVLEENNADLTNALSRDMLIYENSQTAIQVFGSRRILETVIDTLDLTENPEFNPMAETVEPRPDTWISRRIDQVQERIFPPDTDDAGGVDDNVVRQTTLAALERHISFIGLPNDRLIRVSAKTGDPDLSAALANTAADAFLSDLLNTRLEALDGVVEQLGNRVVDLRLEVRQKELDLQHFVNSVGFTSEAAIVQRRDTVARLRDQIERLTADLAQRQAHLQQIDALTGQSDSAISAAFRDNEDLVRLADELDIPPTAQGVAEIQDELQQTLQRNAQQIAGLNARLAEQTDLVDEESQSLLRYQQLEREVEASREIYNFSVRRLNELSVQSGVERSGGRVVLPAEAPLNADGRGLVTQAIFLGLLGVFTGIAWVLIREATDQRVQYAADVAKILPDIRVVPVPSAPRRWLLDHKAQDARLLLQARPTAYSEAVAQLRAALLLGGKATSPMVVRITSDFNSTGKAALTVSLARSFALQQKKTLVIDANTHSLGVICKAVGMSRPQNSLQDVLTGRLAIAEALYNDARLDVDFLLADPTTPISGHVMVSEAIPSMIKALADLYDVILIDMPPLLATSGIPMGSGMNDHVLFVASNRVSSIESMSDALTQLPQAKPQVDLVALYGAQSRHHRKFSNYERKLARL